MKNYFKEGKLKNIGKLLKDHIEETRNMPVTIDPNRVIKRTQKGNYPMSKGLLSKYNKHIIVPGDSDKDNVFNHHRLKK